MHIHHDHVAGGHHDHDHQHTHTHEHTHDGVTHTHEHAHEHCHDHEHPHTHDHLHGENCSHDHSHECQGHCHDHDHSHECGGHCHDHDHQCQGHCHQEHTPMEELAALMKYMVNHNTAHANELAQLAQKLGEAGNRAAFEQVMAAVSDFEKGNMRLSAVLASLDI